MILPGYQHAVLEQSDADVYYTVRYDGYTIDRIINPTIETLLTHMEHSGIYVLWVMPGCDFSNSIERSDFDNLSRDAYSAFIPTAIKDKPGFARIRRQGNSREMNRYLSLPEWNMWTRNEHWELPSAMTLNHTVDYVQQELGRPLMWSLGHVALDSLKEEHQSRRGDPIQPFDKGQAYLWDKFAGEHGRNMMPRPNWSKLQLNGRPGLSKDDREKKFVIVYDKNWQYGGAANSVTLGSGGFTEVPGSAYNPKSIGFWHYRITDARSLFNGYDLYCPLDVSYSWASTRLIEAARYVGVQIEILEGIVWEKGGRYLEQWTKKHWQRRVNLRDPERYPDDAARRNAQKTTKAYGNSLFGKFASEYTEGEYNHAEWNWLIIHQAIASQVYSINKLAQDYDIVPVLVFTDSFFILSDTPDPAAAIPGILDHQDELRGFKCAGVARLTPKIVQAFSDYPRSPADRVQGLLKVIKEGIDSYAR